jgi:predicted GNAT family acetyltransferase
MELVRTKTCNGFTPNLRSGSYDETRDFRAEPFMSFAIQHDSRAHRFHADVEGAHCVLDYALDSGVMTITHTEVPASVGGRGIASDLVQAALDHARGEDWKVAPQCSYAAAWVQRHPAYADLLA